MRFWKYFVASFLVAVAGLMGYHYYSFGELPSLTRTFGVQPERVYITFIGDISRDQALLVLSSLGLEPENPELFFAVHSAKIAVTDSDPDFHEAVLRSEDYPFVKDISTFTEDNYNVFPGLVVLFNPGTTTSQLDQLIASDPRFNLISLEGGSRLWYSVVVSGFRKDKVIEQLNNELSVIATGEIPESSLAKFE